MRMRITPSVLSADLSNLAAEVTRIPDADFVHLDVMDGRFVPNMSFGLPVVESLRKNTAMPMDVHLMVSDPDLWAPRFADVGCESVTFHIEAAQEPVKIARELRSLGARACMALKPNTSIEDYADLVPEFDMILIMTVEPGFGGQAFMAEMMAKVACARDIVRRLGKDIWIQVDGGVSESTIDECIEAGADTFVVGSAVYSSKEPNAVIRGIRARIHQ